MKRKLIIVAAILLVATLTSLGTSKVSDTTIPPNDYNIYNKINEILSTIYWDAPPISNNNPMGLCSGGNFDLERESGWPLHFQVNDITEPGCSDQVYPIIYICDALIFAAALSLVYIVTNKVIKRRR